VDSDPSCYYIELVPAKGLWIRCRSQPPEVFPGSAPGQKACLAPEPPAEAEDSPRVLALVIEKQPTQNTVAKKRAAREDVDSDYLCGACSGVDKRWHAAYRSTVVFSYSSGMSS
jgi:hypothetical protein